MQMELDTTKRAIKVGPGHNQGHVPVPLRIDAVLQTKPQACNLIDQSFSKLCDPFGSCELIAVQSSIYYVTDTVQTLIESSLPCLGACECI